MVAKTARALAADGWLVVQPDLFGCGDSAGEFGDASWEGWIADLRRVIDTWHDGAGELWLWALRAGALLLPPLLADNGTCNLLLWQPSVDGSQVLNQFLRMRTAAESFGGDRSGDRKALREMLARGKSIEVAGYQLTPSVANPLSAARFDVPSTFSGRIVWLDIVSEPEEPVAAPSARLLQSWSVSGRKAEFERVVGLPFWQTVEISEAPALAQRTRKLLGSAQRATTLRKPMHTTDETAVGSAAPYTEQATWVDCSGDRMLGVLVEPAAIAPSGLGVVIVVGGPQYRVGSHRQFVLLARRLASAGHMCLRFDYRGMGDSEGAPRSFEDAGDDLRAALDFLCARPGVRAAIVWGLCDAASAALMFVANDPRVGGLVLVNPWVRGEATLARTYLKHYYVQRLFDGDVWARLLLGRLPWRASLSELSSSFKQALQRRQAGETRTFQRRMADAWRRFRGPILLALSGRDLTAREFLENAATDPHWHGLLARQNVQRVDLSDADHTFSTARWRAWLEDRTLDWLASVAGKLHGLRG
jgi:exosortase A-associated hydrolase 1/exosortase A-associated hydrolase 2